MQPQVRARCPGPAHTLEQGLSLLLSGRCFSSADSLIPGKCSRVPQVTFPLLGCHTLWPQAEAPPGAAWGVQHGGHLSRASSNSQPDPSLLPLSLELLILGQGHLNTAPVALPTGWICDDTFRSPLSLPSEAVLPLALDIKSRHDAGTEAHDAKHLARPQKEKPTW